MIARAKDSQKPRPELEVSVEQPDPEAWRELQRLEGAEEPRRCVLGWGDFDFPEVHGNLLVPLLQQCSPHLVQFLDLLEIFAVEVAEAVRRVLYEGAERSERFLLVHV
jgi:hypothetical protein